MKVFLDENFPLTFLEHLRKSGYEADHVITKSMRGVSDLEIASYLTSDQYVFFTKDADFLDLLDESETILFVSRIPQTNPLEDRIEYWLEALDQYSSEYKGKGHSFFEITTSGLLEPLEGKK